MFHLAVQKHSVTCSQFCSELYKEVGHWRFSVWQPCCSVTCNVGLYTVYLNKVGFNASIGTVASVNTGIRFPLRLSSVSEHLELGPVLFPPGI